MATTTNTHDPDTQSLDDVELDGVTDETARNMVNEMGVDTRGLRKIAETDGGYTVVFSQSDFGFVTGRDSAYHIQAVHCTVCSIHIRVVAQEDVIES